MTADQSNSKTATEYVQVGHEKIKFINIDRGQYLHSYVGRECRGGIDASEGNRCFYVHVAVATGINPFSLAVAMRYLAKKLLSDMSGK